jgi:sulfite exporter TauE/SafE
VWAYAQPVLRMPAGAWLAGMAWALMPCGLLYSAVLVAALSGSATAGAASMGAFAVGGALWLWMAPKVWQTLHARINTRRAGWGTRAAGGMLVGVALAALWTDLIVQPNAWCR